MATTDRDLYDVLGVPRDADETTLKRAFRRLARELHPDVNDAPDAEERFREVTEAYEVLSNSETPARPVAAAVSSRERRGGPALAVRARVACRRCHGACSASSSVRMRVPTAA